MTTYAITLANGTELQIAAARFVSDGSGVRLYDAAGEMIAFWSDGQVKAIGPASAS